jgi:3-methyladenine DNA glycosylase AlkD
MKSTARTPKSTPPSRSDAAAVTAAPGSERGAARIAAAYVDFVGAELGALADPVRARQMAAYMKTTMPFYGVAQPEREPVFRQMVQAMPIQNAETYEAVVSALWRQPHREDKYAALTVAQSFDGFVTPDRLPLYERMVREGGWWDLVDEIAGHLVSPLQRRHRAIVRAVMDRWIADADMWVRRAALLSQLGHKSGTDPEQLFDYCLRCAPEKAFFIRKAIGWALRDYSYASPEAVYAFLEQHRAQLSPLSVREGAKQLARSGWDL